MKRLEIGVAADRSLATIFEPLIASLARATDALNKFEGKVKTGVKAATDSAGAEANRMAAQAAKAFAQMEAASAKAAAGEIAQADRAAQGKIRADLKAFDAKLKASQKAAAADAKASEQMVEAAVKAADAKARADKKAADAALREIDRRLEAEKRASDAAAREQMRAQQYVGRMKDRYFADQQRASDRAAEASNRASERESASAGRSRFSIAREAYGTFAGVARRSVGIGAELAGGFGVDFDMGSAMGRGVSLESAAARTTTSAATAVGKTASAEDIKATMEMIQKAGKETALDFNKLANGLEDFVSKSSDLKTGGAILGQLGLIARATGTDVEKLVSAAGDVNKTLDDSPDKAQRLLAIMRLVAKQGAMGNVEVKDLATYMGKMISSGFMFEGSIDKNIGILGAMSQVAMKGGASTAADATRAADAFSRDLTKGAALERFKKAGIEIFADPGEGPGKNTKLLSPEKIITSFMEKSGGNLAMLADLFQNEMSKKVLKGFGNVAEQASKRGEDPIEAVRKEFAKFTASLTEGDVAKAAGVSMGTAEARAQAFQNNLDLVASSLAERVLPQLEKLAPKALELADALSKLVSAAIDNPVTAITAAIVGSIAKAAIGESVKETLTSILKGSTGGAGATAGALGGAGGPGPTSVGRAVATAGIMAGAVLLADQVEQTRKEGVEIGELEFGGGGFGGKGGAYSRGAALARKRRGTAKSAEGAGGDISSLGETLAATFSAQPASGGAAGAPASSAPNPVPPLEALLATQRQANEILARIAANGVGGPNAGTGTSNTSAPVLTGKR